MIRIFVNEDLLKNLEVEKMELEKKLSQTYKRLNENMVMLMKVHESCPWDQPVRNWDPNLEIDNDYHMGIGNMDLSVFL